MKKILLTLAFFFALVTPSFSQEGVLPSDYKFATAQDASGTKLSVLKDATISLGLSGVSQTVVVFAKVFPNTPMGATGQRWYGCTIARTKCTNSSCTGPGDTYQDPGKPDECIRQYGELNQNNCQYPFVERYESQDDHHAMQGMAVYPDQASGTFNAQVWCESAGATDVAKGGNFDVEILAFALNSSDNQVNLDASSHIESWTTIGGSKGSAFCQCDASTTSGTYAEFYSKEGGSCASNGTTTGVNTTYTTTFANQPLLVIGYGLLGTPSSASSSTCNIPPTAGDRLAQLRVGYCQGSGACSSPTTIGETWETLEGPDDYASMIVAGIVQPAATDIYRFTLQRATSASKPLRGIGNPQIVVIPLRSTNNISYTIPTPVVDYDGSGQSLPR